MWIATPSHTSACNLIALTCRAQSSSDSSLISRCVRRTTTPVTVTQSMLMNCLFSRSKAEILKWHGSSFALRNKLCIREPLWLFVLVTLVTSITIVSITGWWTVVLSCFSRLYSLRLCLKHYGLIVFLSSLFVSRVLLWQVDCVTACVDTVCSETNRARREAVWDQWRLSKGWLLLLHLFYFIS